jgi:hypothetical protein
MPLEYRTRLYTISRDINEYDYRHNPGISNKRYSSSYDTVPAGFARESLQTFLSGDAAQWVIENGIAVSVETYVDAATYQYRAVLIAHMTREQQELWREKVIIDKLQNSFKT